jgi:uncharacterized membrane protein
VTVRTASQVIRSWVELRRGEMRRGEMRRDEIWRGELRRGELRQKALWIGLGILALAQIGYPLLDGPARARLVLFTVALGYAMSVSAAALTRGWQAALALGVVTTGGGFVVEAVGVATGAPFGDYSYSGALGPRLAGVPLIIPLAWTWMAWPAWLAASRVAPRWLLARIGLAGLALAAWDLFLDPQMVAEGYWRWTDPRPALPGVPAIPVSNYVGWLAVAIALMALLAALGGRQLRAVRNGPDAPMLAWYLWTYGSSVLAHAVFLGLRASAGWGALGMGLVAIPLALQLAAAGRAAGGRGAKLTAAAPRAAKNNAKDTVKNTAKNTVGPRS